MKHHAIRAVAASLALALVLARASALAAAEPIALHPDNPRVFLFRGRAAVLIGSGEHYGAVVNRDFDYRRYLDTLAKDGLALTRLFVGTYYEQPGEFRQARVGYEYTVRLPAVQMVLGAEYASQGFFGGGVAAAVGGDVYGLIGVSRTNEKPYFNLNFDPNDAWIFGFGAKLPQDTSVLVYQVHGEWVAAGQRVTHAVLRTKPSPDTRLSVDAFYKSGPLEGEDGGTVSVAGIAVALDYKAWFARIAWDPNVNFTPNDMVRVALGLRF